MKKKSKIYYFCASHKYALFFVLFLLVIIFCGEYTIIAKFSGVNRIERLEDEILRNENQYKRDSVRIQKLKGNPEGIKNIARERYYMKAENEDVYIIRKNSDE